MGDGPQFLSMRTSLGSANEKQTRRRSMLGIENSIMPLNICASHQNKAAIFRYYIPFF